MAASSDCTRCRNGCSSWTDLFGGEGPIDECLSIVDGRLLIERCDAASLAAQFGTPLYVISEDQLRRNVRAFYSEFRRGWPEGEVVVMPSI